jgi:hypothetical protein
MSCFNQKTDDRYNKCQHIETKTYFFDRHRHFTDGSAGKLSRENENCIIAIVKMCASTYQRATGHTTNSSVMNGLPSTIVIRHNAATSGPISTTNGQVSVPSTSSSSSSAARDASFAMTDNNQQWKQVLLTSFKKNTRNILTAKPLQSKQLSVPIPIANNDVVIHQQIKSEQSIVTNSSHDERTLQGKDHSILAPSLAQTSVDHMNSNKVDTMTSNNNCNDERVIPFQVRSNNGDVHSCV